MNTPAVLRGHESLAPVVAFPNIERVCLEHSILSLNVKTSLPSLHSLRLVNESTLQSSANSFNNLKSLELDNYQNRFSLTEAKLETVQIDGTQNEHEGLVMLNRLLSFEVCSQNKQTTVFIDTLYTPWDPDPVLGSLSNVEELDRLEACDCDLAGNWE